MKNRTILNFIGVFFVLLAVALSCEKDDMVKLDAQNETWQITNITSTTAEISGMIVAEGEGYSEYGVCWSKTTNPTIENNKLFVATIEKTVYKFQATGLEHLTKYYAKAYVKTTAGEVKYGEEVTFTTLAHIPTVTLKAILTDGKAAATGGDVSYDGKADVTEKGICWSKTATPTIANNVVKSNEVGVGPFNSEITGLDGATTYYVRAYAKNKMGIAYSAESSFTTDPNTPTVTSDSVRNITKTTFDAYGNALATGGADVTERGICWGLTTNPTIAGNKLAASAAGLGSFKVTVEGLVDGTEYYVRAYAKNSTGTEYGANIKIKTVSDIQKLWLPGNYQQASGYSDGNWNPATAPYIINTKDYKVLEGYIYFSANTEFKFTTDQTWDDAWGDGDKNGVLDKLDNNNILLADAGLYKITVDLVTKAYTVTKIDWRLIGDAVGGWGDANEVDMVYNKSLKRLVATTTFVASGFKFRGNRNWDINYGDNPEGAPDGLLEPGGANIPSTVGTYSILMNLSTEVAADDVTKKAYSYVVTQWGLIGDAVGGWGTDVNMTGSTDNKWSYTGNLLAGPIKFRANDGWDINLGGASFDKLTFGGDNLNIATPGIYTVVLDLVTGSSTVTPVGPVKRK